MFPHRTRRRATRWDELWRTYYGSIFNPARINLRAMKREMPVRHWATLPETRIIHDLLRDAPRRVEDMMKRTSASSKSTTTSTSRGDGKCDFTGSAADFLPQRITLPQLREASKTCRGCDLYCNATQTVFGEGPSDALVVFVGEQPGDQEDLAGKPFVGPAGRVLDEALDEAGIPRDQVYVTNAVKHFKFEQRGERRLHGKPSARQVNACKPWLEAELQVVKPQMVVCLGATASQSLLGRDFRLTKHRGEVMHAPFAPWVLATVHPSSLLRIPDHDERAKARAMFVEDLKQVAHQLRAEIRKAQAKHAHHALARGEHIWQPRAASA